MRNSKEYYNRKFPVTFIKKGHTFEYPTNPIQICNSIAKLYHDEVFVPVYHSPLIYNVFGGRYYVSNYGNVYDYKLGQFVNIYHNNKNYCAVTLAYYDSPYSVNYRQIFLHRLVAYYFLAAPEWTEIELRQLEVNHKDGNKDNNTVWNLEWCTPEYNRQHAMETGLILSGERHPFTFISDSMAEKICQLIITGKSNQEIEAITGTPAYLISRIRAGESFTNISKKYDVRSTIKEQRKDLSEQDVINICVLIMKGASFKEIMEKTGASYSQIHDIKYSKTYKDIKSMFRLDKAPSLKEQQRGLTDQDVHKICQLLQDGKTIIEIAREVGVNKSVVNNIKNCGYYSDISSQYTFNRSIEKRDHTEEDIRKVCELIQENKYTIQQIANMVGKTVGFVQHIKRGNTYTNISSQYTFPKQQHTDVLSDDKIREVCSLLVHGKSFREIERLTGVKDHTVSRIYKRKTYTDISKNYKW